MSFYSFLQSCVLILPYLPYALFASIYVWFIKSGPWVKGIAFLWCLVLIYAMIKCAIITPISYFYKTMSDDSKQQSVCASVATYRTFIAITLLVSLWKIILSPFLPTWLHQILRIWDILGAIKLAYFFYWFPWMFFRCHVGLSIGAGLGAVKPPAVCAETTCCHCWYNQGF